MKTKAFEVKGGKVKLKSRLSIFSKGVDLQTQILERDPSSLPERLIHLRACIEKWRTEEPEHPLVNDIKTESRSEMAALSKLELVIDEAERHFREGNHLGLAMSMYSIGEAVGRLNHVEGWNDSLVSAANRSKGSPEGGKKMKELADDRKGRLRDAAVEYFTANRTHTNKKAATFLQKDTANIDIRAEANMYTRDSLIRQVIDGCKEEALNQL